MCLLLVASIVGVCDAATNNYDIARAITHWEPFFSNDETTFSYEFASTDVHYNGRIITGKSRNLFSQHI